MKQKEGVEEVKEHAIDNVAPAPSEEEPSPSSSVHLVHLAVAVGGGALLALGDEDADQAASEHSLVVDPGVDLSEEAGAVAAGGAEELALAAGVEGQVGGEVVDAAAERGPGVAAAPAVARPQLRRRHPQVRRPGRQAPQVRRRRPREPRPV